MIALRSLLICILFGTALHVSAKQEILSIQENTPQAVTWNRFVDNLYKLHKHIISNFPIRTEEEMGGYGGYIDDPQFYREVRYYNAKNGRLMSKIQWERKNPKQIHTIELFIYDTKGRVIRDYTASFLPDSRNAPIQTFINMHNYNSQLQGYRQFDASGNRIYEHCAGKFLGKDVEITIDDYELSRLALGLPKIMSSKAYLSCFEGIPTDIGKFRNPLSEISTLPKTENVEN